MISCKLGGYKYKKSVKAAGLTLKKNNNKITRNKKYRKNKKNKKNKKKLTKNCKDKKKNKKKSYKGGSNIEVSRLLNNIPFSQGYRIDNSTDTLSGRLANPIPYSNYSKCPN
tara:strand:- start:68 stop:403 length:336 start_codon:yes stop_codon:yes gene_type:complete